MFIILNNRNYKSIKKDCRFLIKDGGWFIILEIDEALELDRAPGLIGVRGIGKIEGNGGQFPFSMTFDPELTRGYVEI